MNFLSPYSLLLKVGAAAIAAAAFFALLAGYMSRGQEISRLTDWQDQVVVATTSATVQPDAKGRRVALNPNQVPDAIAGLKGSLDGYVSQMKDMTAETDQATARAENADAALAKATVIFEQRYASAEKRIAALDSRPPARDPATACAQIMADSKAAWEGWR